MQIENGAICLIHKKWRGFNPATLSFQIGSFNLAFGLAVAIANGSEAQSLQLDEAGSVIVIIVDRAFFEGHQIFTIEAIGAVTGDDVNIAL